MPSDPRQELLKKLEARIREATQKPVFASPPGTKKTPSVRKNSRKEADTKKKVGSTDGYPDDLALAWIPRVSTTYVCASCHSRLPGGTRHWRLLSKRSRTWWCARCMSIHCSYPLPENIPHVEQGRPRRIRSTIPQQPR